MLSVSAMASLLCSIFGQQHTAHASSLSRGLAWPVETRRGRILPRMEAERTVASRQIYQGRLINLRVDEVEMPNGHRSTREIVEHPGAVAVVAFTDDRQLVLVRQYRKAANLLTLEIPAGTLGAGEQPLACASRELKEETGFSAHTFEPIC